MKKFNFKNQFNYVAEVNKTSIDCYLTDYDNTIDLYDIEHFENWLNENNYKHTTPWVYYDQINQKIKMTTVLYD